MSDPWRDWDHVLKLDPDKELYEDETFADIANCGTDALEIGGTLGITREKMASFVDRAAEHDIPIYQEPSNPSVVVDRPGLDGYLVPVVFNAGDVFWVTGAQKEWVRLENGMDWDRTTTEAYIVMNPDASVAEYTEADCDLTAEDVAAYAEVAEQMFGQDIIYTEYSGTFGDPKKIEAATNALEDATLFYGGGIHDYDTANTMSQHADVVVVGDLVHDEGVDAVTETVNGAKDR